MIVALIGYRGTGKSTVAGLLARRLNWQAVDTDQLVEQRAGQSIRQIFAAQGEAGFRQLEAQTIQSLLGRDQVVLSLGGGAILCEDTRQALAGVYCCWLTASPATLRDRLARDERSAGQRPALTPAGLLDEIETVLRAREPFYSQCARRVIDTEGKTPDDVAEELFQMLRTEGPI